MKNFTFLVSTFLFSCFAVAQSDSTFLFLDKSDISSGILFESGHDTLYRIHHVTDTTQHIVEYDDFLKITLLTVELPNKKIIA
jgi:hypothetical protein